MHTEHEHARAQRPLHPAQYTPEHDQTYHNREQTRPQELKPLNDKSTTKQTKP